jgi:hypothetical protein
MLSTQIFTYAAQKKEVVFVFEEDGLAVDASVWGAGKLQNSEFLGESARTNSEF